MNDTQEKKITNAQIEQNQAKLKAKYEAEIETAQQEILSLKNDLTVKDNEIFELQKDNKNLSKDRDEWKQTAHEARRVQAESKQTKEANDFKSEFIKLQQKKRGLTWSEDQGWVKMN